MYFVSSFSNHFSSEIGKIYLWIKKDTPLDVPTVNKTNFTALSFTKLDEYVHTLFGSLNIHIALHVVCLYCVRCSEFSVSILVLR